MKFLLISLPNLHLLPQIQLPSTSDDSDCAPELTDAVSTWGGYQNQVSRMILSTTLNQLERLVTG